HQVPVRLRDEILDSLLARSEHQLLELPVRNEQRLRSRGFEGHAAFGPDDRVAEVDAATDTERASQCLELFDELDGRERAAVEPHGSPLLESDDVALRIPR